MLSRLFANNRLQVTTRYFSRKFFLTQPTPSLHEQVTKFFTKFELSQQMMSLGELADFMSKTFLRRHFTFEEHASVVPVI